METAKGRSRNHLISLTHSFMNYQEFQPNPILSRFIECFWILESNDPKSPPEPQKILPDGCIELLFHFKSLNRRFISDKESIAEPRSFFSGQIKRAIVIQATGATGVGGVRGRPAGAYPFLQLPIAELTERVVDLTEICGREGHELNSKMLESLTNQERILHVESFLLNRLNETLVQDAMTRQAVMEIIRSKGQASIDFLMHNIGISGRKLERKFERLIGLTPKTFSRIIRFQNVFDLLSKNRFQHLTMLALQCGFYDQAHFIHEFNEFTGQSPTAYFSKEHKMAAFFTSSERMSNFYNPA